MEKRGETLYRSDRWWWAWLHAQSLESGHPASRQLQANIPVEALILWCWMDMQCLLHPQFSKSAGPVDHTRLLPSNWVVLLPRMLSNHRLLLLSFPACILVFANSLVQPSCRFPYVHLPATTRNTIYYTRTHASWQLWRAVLSKSSLT